MTRIFSAIALYLSLAGHGGVIKTPEAFEAAWKAYQQDHTASVEREGIVGSASMLIHEDQIVGRHEQGLGRTEPAEIEALKDCLTGAMHCRSLDTQISRCVC